MQKILSAMRKAITDYQMIVPGDRVAVGISGGKDSLVLFEGLCRLRAFLDIPFSLVGITLDMGFSPRPDYGPIHSLAESHGVPYLVKDTGIGPIIFEVRQEANPCSLCARMRRGALHDAAKEQGCNKIALGHHMDDAVETFFMNLFHEGRIGCFSPVSYLSRKELTLIRPLIYLEESQVSGCAAQQHLPVAKSRCPADGVTARQTTKEFVSARCREDKGFRRRIFGAIQRGQVSGFQPPAQPGTHKGASAHKGAREK